MNRLGIEERARILGCLVEGNSIRATCRMTGAAKGTVIKLLADVGAACKAYHDKHVRNVTSRRVQCDEIWSFVDAKGKNAPPTEGRARAGAMLGLGRAWRQYSKMILSYIIGLREAADG